MLIFESIICFILVWKGWSVVNALDWTGYAVSGQMQAYWDAMTILLFAAAMVGALWLIHRVTRHPKRLELSLAYGWRAQVLWHFGKGAFAFLLAGGLLAAMTSFWSVQTRLVLFLVMTGVYLMCVPTCFFRDTRKQVGWLAGVTVLMWLIASPFDRWSVGLLMDEWYRSLENPVAVTRTILVVVDGLLLTASLFLCGCIHAPRRPCVKIEKIIQD